MLPAAEAAPLSCADSGSCRAETKPPQFSESLHSFYIYDAEKPFFLARLVFFPRIFPLLKDIHLSIFRADEHVLRAVACHVGEPRRRAMRVEIEHRAVRQRNRCRIREDWLLVRSNVP